MISELKNKFISIREALMYQLAITESNLHIKLKYSC